MAPIVTTRSGPVQGTMSGGVATFLGIPYAASPTGPRRFGAPEPPQPWDTVRPATDFGPTPPVPGYRPPTDRILYQPTIPGDDWLTVNVWTPDPAGAGLPVMVWIYGGAFVNGNSAIPIYNGQAFARDGVVLVSFNYRLGVEGFAALPDAPANRALLDQVAALEWVQDNIAAFGGDPGKVTVFGESAGAMSVTSLLTMPRAGGLFSQAIAQSGAAQAAADPVDTALVTGELGQQLGLTTVTAASLAGLGVDELVNAQQAVSEALTLTPDPVRFGASVVSASMAFIPVVDGDVLPEHPLQALRRGAGADVPLLTGTTTEEFRLFLFPTGVADAVDEAALLAVTAARGVEAATVERYRANRPGASPGDVLAAIVTDLYFRMPMTQVVEARNRTGNASPNWVYEFAWGTDHERLGAAHALELPFVFDTLQAQGADWITGSQAPQQLAEQTHAAWVRFATTGDPGWAPYDEERAVRVFDVPDAETMRDPRGDERVLHRG